jgi:hypothetical protein
MIKNNQSNKTEIKRSVSDSKILSQKPKELINIGNMNRSQSNPEYLIFENIKNIFDSQTFKIIIKVLNLFNEVKMLLN